MSNASGSLVVLAPLAGWAGPLDEVPDPVFADRMLGDGIAIDPTGAVLHAPCAGAVISVHHSCHAVTLRAGNGAELLLHIGLETVALGGDGFEVHVADGQRVAAGDRLVSFDLDRVATRAKSLITPVIVTNGNAFTITGRGSDRLVAVGEPLFELVPTGPHVDADAAQAAARTGGGGLASRRFTVGLEHGVHARPAAAIANRARGFGAAIELRCGAKRADARSAVAVMALGLTYRVEAEIVATGSDAAAAVAALLPLFEPESDQAAPARSGLQSPAASLSLPVAAIEPPSSVPAGDVPSETILKGVTAAPGLAIGTAYRFDRTAAVPITVVSAGADAETASLANAIGSVRGRLDQLTTTGSAAQRGIMAAHLTLLDDPEINTAAAAAIAGGNSAAAAWSAALAPSIAALRAVADPRIAARADDLLDLDYQVGATLARDAGTSDSSGDRTPALPDRAILLAHDLLPSQLIGLDPARLAGIATVGGGPTSHVAIIAAAMNLPAIVALGPALLGIADGTTLILDADGATLHIDPAPALLEATGAQLAARAVRRRAAAAAAGDDCRMADGTRIEVFANLGSLDEAHAAVSAGAEGCGLLRTELLFLDRHDAPGVEEQAALYQAIATAFDPRSLIIRTLDIGGDKPVPYLSIPPEDNPALGLRGIRVGLWQPRLLREQLTAILRVQPAGQCRILLPMINDLAELLAVRRIVDELTGELGLSAPVQLGVMIETPAAAVSADMLAAEADFFAIGTNDLTQYTLAMDRGNPQLAAQVDGLHPAVLRLIDQAVRGAAQQRRPVGVCGGLASDLVAVPILLGLGVTELSAVPVLIPAVKALVRTITMAGCVGLAARALAQTSAEAVRALRLGGE